MHHLRRAGFTLIEMAAVLAIITLVIGAIFEGKSLVHGAQMQSVTTDFNKLNTAYIGFKQLYGSNKPGDFNNTAAGAVQKATDIWGSAGTTNLVSDTARCASQMNATSKATCDGDGNGYIAGPYSTGALTNPNEIYSTFQQLSAAKMLDVPYAGNPTGGAQAGVNVPSGQVDGAAFMFLSQAPIADATSATNSPYYFYGNYGSQNVNGVLKAGTYIVMGSIGASITKSGASSNLPENEVLRPDDAYLIDRKMDDGLPAFGQVLSYYAYPDGTAIGTGKCLLNNGAGPVNASNGNNITYNMSYTQPACNLIYVNDVVLN